MNLKIIFIGTPRFASIILEKLVENNYKPVLAITAPDKRKGRKKILTPPDVKITAKKHNIDIIQPKDINNLKDEIKGLNPDLIILTAYSQILKKDILEIPKYGCLNIHPSILPKYRGPSPIQTAILNGDKKTGITIYLMDEKIDHGKIISICEFPISLIINCQELSEELAQKGAELLIETIPKLINGKITPFAQNEKEATYTKIIRKEDGRINWRQSSKKIERRIRAYNKWPGSFTFWEKNDKKTLRIKIIKAEESDIENNKKPGQVFSSDNNLLIKCQRGSLIVKELQVEGKKPMKSDEFLKGNKDFINTLVI